MKKVLFVATVTFHINTFHIPYLKWFKEQGYEVHVASNGEENIEYCDKHFNIPFARFPLKLQNYKAYKELKKIIQDNEYEIIHCHTPVGGVLTRLAAKNARKKGTRVIYTAHGFHFYKGAPLVNWLLFYPVEWYLSKYTDTLITINKVDYELAKKKFRAKQVEFVHGVGMDTKRFDISFSEEQKEKIKEELNIIPNDMVLTYVAELNKNKNQELLINCVERLKKEGNINIKLLLVGSGQLDNYYKELIREKNLEENVKLLGIRKDVGLILSITDIYVASSIREGLPVNIMEAMYMGLPIIATRNRGHVELVNNERNGYTVEYNDINGFTNKLKKLIDNEDRRKEFGTNSKEMASKYIIDNVMKEMMRVYK